MLAPNIMSSPRDITDDEIDAELAAAEQKMEEEMAEKRRVVQEHKAALKKAKEEKARKAEEAGQKAEAEEKAKAEEKAEAERQAKEAQDKAEAVRKVREAREKTEWDEKAERVRLANRTRLYRELIEFKERNEAEAKRKAKEVERNKAGDGMMLATPADLSAIDKARQINAENAKNRVESFKPPWARSSKAPATPKPKPKAAVNLSRQVREQEAMRKSGKLGKTGEVAVRVYVFFAFLGFSDMSSPDYQLRHVQEPQGSLRLRISDCMPGLQRTKSSVFFLGREAEAQGCGDRVG
jgi:hypothetical protein